VGPSIDPGIQPPVTPPVQPPSTPEQPAPSAWQTVSREEQGGAGATGAPFHPSEPQLLAQPTWAPVLDEAPLVRYPRRQPYQAIQTALVPCFAGEESSDLLEAALGFAYNVVVLGLVRVEGDELLSAGAAAARDLRDRLRSLAHGRHDVTTLAQVYVSSTPWKELQKVAAEVGPDLLLLDFDTHLAIMGVTPAQVLETSPCDIGLLRGRLPATVDRVLLPIRGGPHADLVVKLGLSLGDATHTALHLRRPDTAGRADAPFRGLQQVLPQLPGIEVRQIVTEDPAQRILEESEGYDLVILGATARPHHEPSSLGAVADRVLRETTIPVLVVKHTRPPLADLALVQAASENGAEVNPVEIEGELAGQEAISILVDKWFAENTFHAEEFSNLERLVASKREQGLRVSLALPALNEEATVGAVIGSVKQALMERFPLIDEIVLIDSDSSDRTRAIAQEMGVPVYIHQQLLPRLGARRGKGEALWKSLLVTSGDIVAWIDTDIVNVHPRFVYGIVGPLILNPGIQFVKGFYQRPLRVGGALQQGGGRVTELMARPLLNLFYPELSGVIQPLSGEYAGRRSALEQAPFYSGYGVETGLLIDIFERYGLGALAQVDLLERVHHNQPLESLSKMAFAILQVVLQRIERRTGASLLADVNRSMKLIRSSEAGYSLDVEEIIERERPAMVAVQEYLRRQHALQPERVV
jgi:glucosyl-3-phosphoglycerate synthase